MLQIVWQGPRASQTLRLYWRRLSTLPTAGHVHTSATYMYAHCCCSSHFYANRCGCRCNVRRGMCSIELKLFRSALGMGKIIPVLFFCMCGIGLKLQVNEARYARHSRHSSHGEVNTTLGKIIPAFDLKGFKLVLSH